MTLKTIRDPIMRDLGLDTSSTLNDDVIVRINDYINEAIADLSIIAKWDLGKSPGAITLATGDDVYSLASTAYAERIIDEKFWIVSENRRVVKLEDDDFIRKLVKPETGLPLYWRPYGVDSSNNHQIQVFPVPTADENGLSMAYNYTKDLTALTGDSDVSEMHETMIRHLAKSKYYRYDQDFKNYEIERNISNSLIKTLKTQNRGGFRFTPDTRRNHEAGD